MCPRVCENENACQETERASQIVKFRFIFSVNSHQVATVSRRYPTLVSNDYERQCAADAQDGGGTAPRQSDGPAGADAELQEQRLSDIHRISSNKIPSLEASCNPNKSNQIKALKV